MAQQVDVDLIVEAISKGFGKVAKDLDKVEKEQRDLTITADKSGGILNKVKENWMGITAGLGAAAGAVYTVKKAWDFASEGAQIEKVRDTFDSLTTSIGETSSAVLVDMRKATAGMVSDTDLIMAANRNLSMGLASSGAEAAKLANIAVTLGQAMGKDATGAMEEFSLMLANQSIPRLDTFGISAGRVRERIKELQAANKDLSRETAFMTAVMEEADISMERLGGAIQENEFDQVAAEVANLTDELKLMAATVLGPVAEAVAEILKQNRATKEANRSLEDYRKLVDWGIMSLEEYRGVINAVTNQTITHAEATEYLQGKLDRIEGTFASLSHIQNIYSASSEEAAEATALTAEEVEKANEGLEAYGAALASARAAQRGYASSSYDANAALEYMGQNFRIGEANLGLLNEELDDLGQFMVTVGGRTADQNEILGDARQEYNRLGDEIARMTAAPELYGMTVSEAAEKTQELAERQAELLPLIGRMEDITGTAALATKEATVNQEALNRALFEAVKAEGASTKEIVALGLALGTLNQEQADAIVKSWELTEGIKAIEQAYKDERISADEAKQAVLLLGQEGPAAMYDFLESLTVTGDKAGTLADRIDAIRQRIEELPTHKRIEF